MEENYNTNAEQDVALTIISLLDDGAQHLTTDTLVKLELGRQRALTAHMSLRTAPAYGLSGMSHSLFDYFDKHRALMSSGLAFGALIAAFLIVQPFSNYSKNEHSDAFLLGSELPPEAYADKGFDTWVDLGS